VRRLQIAPMNAVSPEIVHHSRFDSSTSEKGLVSRVTPVQTAKRNCTRDEGGPFEFGNQVLISNRRKLLSAKAMVVNVAETSGHEPGRYGRERGTQANRCGSVEIGLDDVKTGG